MKSKNVREKINCGEMPVMHKCSIRLDLVKNNYYNEWNITLNSLDRNKIIPSENNPKSSGQYLCTCVSKSGELIHKYLCIMEYNADKSYWHDVGNPNNISHIILAWKEQDVCTFDDFEYKAGVLFKKTDLK